MFIQEEKFVSYMDVSIIENSYDFSFHPLLEINDDDLWLEKEIAYGRCSAFPVFLKTYDDLIENVDRLSSLERSRIMQRFQAFLEDLSEHYVVYSSYKKTPDVATLLTKVDIDCVNNLVHDSMINLFVPELQIVCIGHDDFGFILLSKENNDNIEIIRKMISENSIYLLKMP